MKSKTTAAVHSNECMYLTQLYQKLTSLLKTVPSAAYLSGQIPMASIVPRTFKTFEANRSRQTMAKSELVTQGFPISGARILVRPHRNDFKIALNEEYFWGNLCMN